MTCRTLDVTVLRAEDIKVVNFLTSMDVYAVISISGDPRTRQRTSLHVHGHRNPRWNQSFRFAIPAADPSHLALHVRLRSDRRLIGDLDIGEVYVPLRDLLAAPAGKSLSFPVCSSSGGEKGCLFLAYNAGGPVADPAATDKALGLPFPAKPAAMYEEPPAPAKEQGAVAGYTPPPYAQWGPYPPAVEYPPYMPPYGYEEPPLPPKNALPPPPYAQRGPYPPAVGCPPYMPPYGYDEPPPPPKNAYRKAPPPPPKHARRSAPRRPGRRTDE